MDESLVYTFEWDPRKAGENDTRHGVAFELAATVFRDPLHVAVFDADHSEAEERWVTLELGENGRLLVVVHTLDKSRRNAVKVRIISAREATRRERQDYEDGREAREPMRPEYDFSKGERGKFYRPGATLVIPVYLEPEVQALVADRAAKAGTSLNAYVNQLLLRGVAVERPRPEKVRRTAARQTGRRRKR